LLLIQFFVECERDDEDDEELDQWGQYLIHLDVSISMSVVGIWNSVFDFEFFKLIINRWAFISLAVNRGVTGQYLYTKLRYYNNVNKVLWIIDTVIILQLPYS
jgi:hypothetical protein